MSGKTERAVVGVCLASALLLAVSFALPLTERATVVDSSGRPVGLLGQLFSGPDSPRVTTYGYFWEDLDWMVPLVFFSPALLVVLRQWGAPRLRKALTLAAPPVAACLLVALAAMVEFADFGVLPGTGGQRAFGGYVALGALVCFLVAASVLAAVATARMYRSRARPAHG